MDKRTQDFKIKFLDTYTGLTGLVRIETLLTGILS
jgi:hypothetical protein